MAYRPGKMGLHWREDVRVRLAAVALLTVSVNSCTGPSKSGDLPQVTPAAQVLIAAEQSKFKRAVVSKVTERLDLAGRSCHVAGLEVLRHAKPEDHVAVVILNEIWAWRLSRDVRHFLKRIPPDQREKIVLVSTADSRGWRANEEGIDAMTAASTEANRPKAEAFIMEKVNALFLARSRQGRSESD